MLTREEAKKEITKLIERYHKYKEDENLMKNERQICDSLIRPFFRDVLGWNIEDPYEFKSEYGQGGKRIDYLACIEGISQFVIEAKAPSRDIKQKSDFYKQAVQYAEAKGKDFAILTNFTTFIIFRAGIETAGIFANEIRIIDLLNPKDLDIDFLLYFSKDFWIEKGEENPLYSIKSLKRKKPLDERLVEDMTKWREYLLRNLKTKSKNKYDFENEKELEKIEEEVQRFIDRLIFICYCEDKQLNDNELKPLLLEYRSKHIGKVFLMPNIKKIFEQYNGVYNSDLFKKGLCDEFDFDENKLSEILENLRGYFEGLPYDFSIIDADILGRAYENFLGHILTGKKRFKEKQDIGKRKKMGIYYTPQYIVNYIIKNTVRERIKNLSFKEVLKIKILDLACGSGSFLIKAFDILVEESKTKLKRDLTYEEKKDLLINCIYGVDLDERACDIAKLNLSLKLATRGEKIPLLHQNIQNGNSLIDNKSVAKSKEFNWGEKFPFKFDVVIGNPPYIRQEHFKEIKPYLKERYETYSGVADIYVYFFERGIKHLKDNGKFGFIVSNKFTRAKYGENLRGFILKNTKILQYIDTFDSKVFEDASVDPCIIILEKTGKARGNLIKYNYTIDINQDLFNSSSWTFGNKLIQDIKTKIERSGNLLKNSYRLYRGITTGFNEAFIIDENVKNNLVKKDKRSLEIIKPILKGENLFRYFHNFDNLYLIYAYTGINIKDYPAVYEHLIEYKKDLEQVWEAKHGKKKWYELRGCKYYSEFKKNKIIWCDISSEPAFTFDKKGYFLNNTSFMIPAEDTWLVAILNSKLMFFYFAQITSKLGSKGYRFIPQYVKQFPIKIPNSFQRQIISELVEKMTVSKKELFELGEKDKYKKQNIEEDINRTEEQIEEEIYKLYNITKEEAKTINNSFPD